MSHHRTDAVTQYLMRAVRTLLRVYPHHPQRLLPYSFQTQEMSFVR